MDILVGFFTDYGYLAVLFVLIICGFGVPIPEDITLVSGGIIAGMYPEQVNVHIMLVVSMFGVLFGDSTMYWLGRIYGARILRVRFIRKFLTVQRLRMVRDKFDQYGNRVLFVARFLPGLRAPIYMVSGVTRRVSYLRFVLLDFFAAIISVPIWVYLGKGEIPSMTTVIGSTLILLSAIVDITFSIKNNKKEKKLSVHN